MSNYISTGHDIFSSRPIAAILEQFPDLYPKICKADKQYRQGPIQRGVDKSNVATIWEHTEEVWLAAKLFPWKAYRLSEKDQEEAELLAFFHDFVVETHGQDYTPYDKITPARKERKERAWKKKFTSSLGPGGECVGDFWETYQAKEKPVAKLIGQLDKLVAIDEAWRLEWSKPAMRPGFKDFSAQEFFENVDKHLKDPFIKWIKQNMQEHYKSGANPEGVFHKLLQSHTQFKRETNQHLDEICYLALGPVVQPPLPYAYPNP